MLYFWITNASRAHRAAGRNEGSGKSTPISVSGKGNTRRGGRKKELSESPSKSCSETQLDKILQKNTPNSSLNGSNSQVPMISSGASSTDVPWMKSRSRGFSTGSSSTNNKSSNAHAIEKHKQYIRKTSSASLW